MDLSLTARPGNGCTVVEVGGVLDLATTPRVRHSLQRALDDGDHFVVLDLTAVRFIDSTALGMVVWFNKQLQERGGSFRVAASHPTVRRVFDLTSVDQIVPLHDSVEAAENDLRTAKR